MSLFILLPVIFGSSLILTMIGLGGGLIFSPFFVLIGFPIPTAVAASLFLNGIAALSALIVYMQKKMVDYSVSIPLVVTSLLGAPVGALMTQKINLQVFIIILAIVLFLAALRMLFSKKVQSQGENVSWQVKVFGGGMIVCFSSFSGFAAHAATASLDWQFILLASICSFAGGQISSRIMAEKLKGKTIRVLFGIILLLMCAKLLHRAVI